MTEENNLFRCPAGFDGQHLLKDISLRFISQVLFFDLPELVHVVLPLFDEGNRVGILFNRLRIECQFREVLETCS